MALRLAWVALMIEMAVGLAVSVVVWQLGWRGGQELGRRWYDAGRLLQKQNSFTDFIDVTRHLVREGYADPARVFGIDVDEDAFLNGCPDADFDPAVVCPKDRPRAHVAFILNHHIAQHNRLFTDIGLPADARLPSVKGIDQFRPSRRFC